MVVERTNSNCESASRRRTLITTDKNETLGCLALGFRFSESIQLSNLTFSGSKGFQVLCLKLDLIHEYSITESVFSDCHVAIAIDEFTLGKLEFINFLDCYMVLVAYTENARVFYEELEPHSLQSLQMHGIYSSGSTEGAVFMLCGLAEFLLANSYFIDSGPLAIFLNQSCVGEYIYIYTVQLRSAVIEIAFI